MLAVSDRLLSVVCRLVSTLCWQTTPITPLANDELHGPRKDGYLKMIEGMPAHRAGTPDEVGNMAEFLMSSRGRFISGADFLIDGGCTASYWYGDLQYLKARIIEQPYYDTVSWSDGNNHASKDGQRTTDERSKSRGQACLHYALQGERRRKSNRSPLPSNV